MIKSKFKLGDKVNIGMSIQDNEIIGIYKRHYLVKMRNKTGFKIDNSFCKQYMVCISFIGSYAHWREDIDIRMIEKLVDKE